MLSSMIARGQVRGKVAKVALGEWDSVELELVALELVALELVVLELVVLELVALELVVLELVAKAALELVALGEPASCRNRKASFSANR